MVLISKGIALEGLLSMSNGQEKYDRAMQAMPYIARYNYFIQLKNLGFTISPNDFSYEDIEIFNMIKLETKDGR